MLIVAVILGLLGIFFILALIDSYKRDLDYLREDEAAEAYLPILLIDMDGVIANYYARFCAIWAEKYPDRKVLSLDELTHMYFENCYDPEYTEDIRRITTSKGFFESLPAMPYAAETLNMILDRGVFRPYLCSTPDSHSENHCCPSEKMIWVEKILGERWLKRLILTHDKTLVHGDYLIDDKPDIHGANPEPSWEHIVFNHKYNEDVHGHRLHSWLDWPELEQELLDY